MKSLKSSILTILIASMILLSGCSPAATVTPEDTLVPAATPEPMPTETPVPVTLTVSAAASLTESFTEIGNLFQAANPGVTVSFNFAGSQELAQQIVQGAPVDVFASANQKQMDVAATEKKIPAETVQNFASNRLVVIYPADNPAGLTQLTDLTKPGLKLVLAGAEVPVGQYSLNFLDAAEKSGQFTAGYKDAVLANVVSYENNVRAVLSKVALGEADAGIVYLTDIGNARDKVGTIDIPDDLNVIATYPIAALPDGPQAQLGQAFVKFVLSDEGQQVLSKYGFSTVK